MKVAEAKKICKDFNFNEDTSKCRFILDGGMCLRSNKFRCDLVLHKEKEELVNSGKELVSVSKIGTLEQCPRLYAFIYIYKIDSPYISRWKIQGKAFSDSRACIDSGKDWSLPEELLSAEKAKIRAVLRKYQECKLNENVLCEQKVIFNYKGVTFLGYIDSITTDNKKINEWKYSNRSYKYLKFIRQACVYLYDKKQAELFSINVANKPQHKMKVDETEEEYEERIFKSLEANKLFSYTVYKRNEFNLEYTLDLMVASWNNRENLEKLNYPPFYSINCYDCDYHYICEAHINKDIGCDERFCATVGCCKEIKKIRDKQ